MQPTALLSIEATERTRPRAMKRKRSQGREGVSGIGCLTSRVRPVEHIRPAAPLRTVGYCRVLSGTVGHCRGGLKRRSISRTWGSDASASPARPSVPRRQPSGPAVEDASCHHTTYEPGTTTDRPLGASLAESVLRAACRTQRATYAKHRTPCMQRATSTPVALRQRCNRQQAVRHSVGTALRAVPV